MQEEQPISDDDVISDVLGENPRASQLRLMRLTLEHRRDAFQKELVLSKNTIEQARLRGKLKALTRQIEVLLQEEGITKFVETSVRVTLSKAAVDDEN